MGQEIAFENGGISNIQGLVTLTLDRVILHTVMWTAAYCQLQSHVTQKLGQKNKIPTS